MWEKNQFFVKKDYFTWEKVKSYSKSHILRGNFQSKSDFMEHVMNFSYDFKLFGIVFSKH